VTAAAAAKGSATPPDGRGGATAVGEKWTTEELAEIRADLNVRASELRGEVNQATEQWTALQWESGESAGDDQADTGSKTFEREHELSLVNNRRDLLEQVDRSLGKLDAGTYGMCESCGRAIPKARLKARPIVTLCVVCKQREERR
jgi:RNA polymerase-binding protein DksA